MIELADWLHAVGLAGLDGFWRPLLVWTLVALPLYAALRWWRSAPPLFQYHAHLALLLALPLGLFLAPFVSWPASPPEVIVPDVPVAASALPGLDAPQPLVEGPALPALLPATSPGIAWSLVHGLGAVMVLAAGGAVFLLLRMLYLAFALRRFRQKLAPLDDPRAHRLLGILAREMGVRDAVTLAVTPEDTTPLTFGWRHPVIALPAALLDDEAGLRLTLRHELIHIRRRDYVVSWVVRLVGAMFAVHPGVWLLRRRIDQYREISCDAETLGDAPIPARQYVQLLLRFSPLTDLAGPAALRMVDLDSTLKKRINAMRTFVKNPSFVRLRRWSLPLAAMLLLLPALLVACATENNTSETVVVTADVDAEDAAHDVILEELEHRLAEEKAALEAMEGQDALALRERELALVERQRQLEQAEYAYREAVALQQAQGHERARVQAQAQLRASNAERRLKVLQERLEMEEDRLAEILHENPELRENPESLQSHKQRIAELRAEIEQQAQVLVEYTFSDQDQQLKRLAVQMEYLQEQIKKASAVLDKLVDHKPMSTLPREVRSEYELVQQRIQLLNALYMQRLEEFETMKMERFTQDALSELRDER